VAGVDLLDKAWVRVHTDDIRTASGQGGGDTGTDVAQADNRYPEILTFAEKGRSRSTRVRLHCTVSSPCTDGDHLLRLEPGIVLRL
jgi:hypothetical protein